MNACKILARCRGLTKNSTLVTRNLVSRSNTNQIVQRRLLMTSLETGGVLPAKPLRRIGLNMKVPAFGMFCLTMFGTAAVFKYDEKIANTLGVDWNMSLVACTLQTIVGYLLLTVTFSATLPI
ncbi:uncharacterized protein LOC144745928 [Ciona intestinalis]